MPFAKPQGVPELRGAHALDAGRAPLETPGRPASVDAVLALQRTAGNHAVASLLRAIAPGRVGVPLLQRALTQNEQDQLRNRALALDQRHQNLFATIPSEIVTASGVREHRAMESIRTVTDAVRHRAAAVAFAPLDAELTSASRLLDEFQAHLDRHRDTLTKLDRLFLVFTGGGYFAAELVQVRADLVRPAKFFMKQQGGGRELENFVRKFQAGVVPEKAAIEKLREKDKSAAMNKVAKLVESGFVVVDNHKAWYESPYDLDKDHFGASFSLSPATESGKAQWIRTWELHVHAVAQYAAAPAALAGPRVPTGFQINVAHVKPSEDPYKLSVSIPIANDPMLQTVARDNRDKFVAWAQTPIGRHALSRKTGA